MTYGTRVLRRNQGVVVAVVACVLIFCVQQSIAYMPFSYFEWSSIVTNAGPLVFATMGLTIVMILRGLDMSCGTTLALVNIFIAMNPAETVSGQIALCAAGIALGGAVGAVNGYFIAFLRLQPVVVTLATMFVLMGGNLLLMPTPGGQVPSGIVATFTYDWVRDILPGAAVVIVAGLLAWYLVKMSRFGTALYATGSNEAAAFANGIDVVRTKFAGYVLAGLFYGVGGVFLAAQTNTGDPLIGSNMLLQIFTAAILGGVSLGGGRGDLLGAIFAALTLVLISSALLNLGVSSDWTSMVEAALLLAAAIGGSLGHIRSIRSTMGGLMPRRGAKRSRPQGALRPARAIPELVGSRYTAWFRRNRQALQLVVPAWTLLLVVLLLVVLVLGSRNISVDYLDALLTLSVFLVVLGLGQGAVVMMGGLDLSIPFTMTFAAVFLTTFADGSNMAMIWAVPLTLLIGAAVGLCNGLLVTAAQLNPIIVTLATNGVMQSAGLLYTGGFVQARTPTMLVGLFQDRFLGFAPAVWIVFAFVALGLWLLHASSFGRKVLFAGSNARVAHLSGIAVEKTTVLVYVLSGSCAAFAGILLAGFSRRATLDMGESFLLPSIAAVLIGGTLASGGRGHYLGILGGCLVLVAVGTLVSGAALPVALRDVVYGVVMLAAVLALRERR